MTMAYSVRMAGWYVDKGLGTLIAQTKQKFPGIVVGTIGDAEHRKRKSAHNPEADSSVDAGDFMIGAKFREGDCDPWVDTLIRNWDSRLHLIIWDRHIITEDTRRWRPYNGTDPHTGHAHVEVNDKHENDNSPWNLGAPMGSYEYEELEGYGLPILNFGDDDADFDGYNGIGRAQCLLNYQGAKLAIDGRYGPATVAAVKAVCGGDGRRIDRAEWVKLAGLSRAV